MKTLFIRDTIIREEVFNTLPHDKQNALSELVQEFSKINYIDVRTQLGPDQARRMSERQKRSIQDNMLKVFEIEGKVKQLLKTDDQLKKENEAAQSKAKEDRINKIKYRIRDIETYLQRKLTSNRKNPTKTEYQELQTELHNLTNQNI